MRASGKPNIGAAISSLASFRLTLSIAICTTVLIAASRSVARVERIPTASATPLAHLSESISVHASGRGNPSINLSDGREVLTSYSGPAEFTQALRRNEAEPLALASSDFDEDGVPDLVCGYGHSGSGIITWLRGNVDSIYQNSLEAQQRKAAGEFTDAPFLSPARVFGLPIEPEFLGAGDFDADGHWDIVAASRISDALYLLSGDGNGGFKEPRRIALDGAVTALVVGEINRRDGLDDVIVAISGNDGPKTLVFEGPDGALRAKPETFDLPAKASALALGQMDDDYPIDLAVAAGRELLVIHGRDRKLSLDETSRTKVPAANITRRKLDFNIRSMAVGDFSGDQGTDIALLSEDGTVHLLSGPLKEPRESDQARAEEAAINIRHPGAHLIRARVSSSSSDDLLALDSAGRELHIVSDYRTKHESREASERFSADGLQRETISLDIESQPAAVLPMRLNADARNGLVVLSSGHGGPSVLLPQAAMTFTVTNTNDNGPGSLREAIVNANDNPGTDTIRFSISGPGVHTISLASPLPVIIDPAIIDGTTQPGFAGTPAIELDGTNATMPSGVAGFQIRAGSTTVRGLAINRFPHDGIVIEPGESTIIEGNFIGTDATGTRALGNGSSGLAAVGPTANSTPAGNTIIGGSTASARNIISGNHNNGVLMSGVGNQVLGNFIGTNVNGTVEIGNLATGVVCASAVNNVIGGTTQGTRNIISGNTVSGVLVDTAGANLVQGNFIGTDVSGRSIVSNSAYGILLTGPNTGNTIGGTVIGARNVISGNLQIGVAIYSGGTGNLVQGNFIGTNAGGTSGMGNGNDGYLSASSDNIVGGAAASARNIISGNGTNRVSANGTTGVSILGAPGNQVQNNYIGTDVTGAVPIGNDSVGILVSGANSTLIKDNIISSNGSHGVSLGGFANDPKTGKVFGGTGSTVQGNFIGTDRIGTRNLGNKQEGIFVENTSSVHTIEENTIAFNSLNGVRIPNNPSDANIPGRPADRIQIGSNSIYSNGALGIDLGEPGVTDNHIKNPIKPEANDGQNFPELNSITTDGVNITIQGKLEMKNKPNTAFKIELFSNTPVGSPGCARQGQHPMSLTEVRTDGNGVATINVIFPVAMAGGYINCTATDPAGNTSEFSDCVQVSTGRPPTLIEIIVSSRIVAVGSNFTTEGVQVFIDGVGFSQQAKVRGGGTRIIQKGRLTDGRSIAEAVPPGKVVKMKFRNSNGGETEVSFRR